MKRNYEDSATQTFTFESSLFYDPFSKVFSNLTSIEAHTLRFVSRQYHSYVHYYCKENDLNHFWNVNVILSSVVERDSVSLIEWWMNETDTKFSNLKDDLLTLSTECNAFKIMKWSKEQGCEWKEFDLLPLIKFGDLEIIKWAKENGCSLNRWCSVFAADAGNIKILEWLKENGTPFDEEVSSWAAGAGDLVTLQWLKEKGCPRNEDCYIRASDNGHLEVLKWLRKEDPEHLRVMASGKVLQSAAFFGHMNILKWVVGGGLGDHEIPLHVDYSILVLAAANNRVEVLKWGRENGCQWNEDATYSAAHYGSLKSLKWLIKNECPIHKRICDATMIHGHLDVLKWLRKKQVPFSSMMIFIGTLRGNFESVEWALKNGCTLPDVFLDWGLKNGCQLPNTFSDQTEVEQFLSSMAFQNLLSFFLQPVRRVY